jgi:hypothetical protein
MPVEGFPDRDIHKICLRCHKWHEPAEGVMVWPPITGPFTALRSMTARLAEGEGGKRFICHRCRRIRRITQIVIFSIFTVLVATILILERLGAFDSATASALALARGS